MLQTVLTSLDTKPPESATASLLANPNIPKAHVSKPLGCEIHQMRRYACRIYTVHIADLLLHRMESVVLQLAQSIHGPKRIEPGADLQRIDFSAVRVGQARNDIDIQGR